MSEHTTRVYQYGLLAPTTNAALVLDQLRRAHQYYNCLAEIERDRRDKIRAIDAGDAALEREVQRCDDAITQHRETLRTKRVAAQSKRDAPEDRARLHELRAERKAHAAVLAAVRAARRTDPVALAAQKAANEAAAAQLRAARAASGCRFGTYQLVEAAVAQAAKDTPLWRSEGVPQNVAFRRWDGVDRVTAGQISEQLIGGASVARIYGGAHTQAQIVPVQAFKRGKNRTTLRIRIGSTAPAREPIWAEFPMIMHRPLPDDARIQRVTVSARRYGHRIRWTCEITVRTTAPRWRGEARVVGVDVGWRRQGQGLRAACTTDAGDLRELLVDPSIEDLFSRVRGLNSVRRKHFDDIHPHIAAWLVAQDAAGALPAELQKRIDHVTQWKSTRRLDALARFWTVNRFAGDSVGFDMIEAWRARNHHLNAWETAEHLKAQRRRRDHYRVFAAKLARAYDVVVLENFKLDEVARVPDVGEHDDVEITESRGQRVRTAISVLRDAITNACSARGVRVYVVPCAYTTRICHECGTVNAWDQARELEHTCVACGVVWDQDINAAINILHRFRESPGDAKQLVGPKPAKAQTTGSRFTRAKQRRSQMAAQPSEIGADSASL